MTRSTSRGWFQDISGITRATSNGWNQSLPAAAGGDVLNQGLSGIRHGVIASGGGGHSGLHPIEEGYVS